MSEEFWVIMGIYGVSALTGCIMIAQWFFLAIVWPTKAASDGSRTLALLGLIMIVPVFNLILTIILLISLIALVVQFVDTSIERRRGDEVGKAKRLHAIKKEIYVLDRQIENRGAEEKKV